MNNTTHTGKEKKGPIKLDSFQTDLLSHSIKALKVVNSVVPFPFSINYIKQPDK